MGIGGYPLLRRFAFNGCIGRRKSTRCAMAKGEIRKGSGCGSDVVNANIDFRCLPFGALAVLGVMVPSWFIGSGS